MVRAVRHPLQSTLAPAEAVRLVAGEDRPFALLGDWAGGGALLGSAPVRVAGADEDPFALLDDQPAVQAEGAVVGGGWFGVLGYRLGHLVEELPADPPAPTPLPAHALAFYDHVIRFDGERWWFEALWSAAREAALDERLEHWRRRLDQPAPAPGPLRLAAFAPRAPGEAAHLAAVAECIERIAAGELFQANLTLRLEAGWSGIATELAARAFCSGSRFGAFVEGPSGAVVSLSPERFLRRIGRQVQTEPIKGTAEDPEVLLASTKDAAEHVMIVDLMRNDLGRVCAYGTIEAHPPRVEPHANVFHLVSSVTGTLRDDAGDADLLRATFPPGSVTGAPKVQSLKVISELEATRREAYTGAIGYASPVAGLELNVAIRTFETRGERIWLGAGGGIVAQSRPEAELAEALDKARGPLDAIGARLAPLHPRTRLPRALPRALDHGPRPDPSHGLLETILVIDGRPRALERHLERLGASAATVYDLPVPGDARVLIEAAAAGATGPCRVRVVATPAPKAVSLAVTLAPIGERPETTGLTPFVLPGGLGAHKWADRRLAAALEAAAGPASTALLVDADGAVLEATWANVWLVEGDGLVTPPADGRLLAGIGRMQLLAEASEDEVDLARLEAADEVFLTSALRTRHRVGPPAPVPA